MLWASKSCNVILEFYFKQKLCGEEHQYTTNSFLFFLKKDQAYKTKKIINISYLIMVLIKMRLLILLVLSRYGLVFKYRIISQISIYNWMQNWIFRYLWCCIFLFLRSNYNLFRQVRWFITWWVENIIISSDSNLTQSIIRETIKVGGKRDGSRKNSDAFQI